MQKRFLLNLSINVSANKESIDALEQDSLTDRKEVMSLEILSKELKNNGYKTQDMPIKMHFAMPI